MRIKGRYLPSGEESIGYLHGGRVAYAHARTRAAKAVRKARQRTATRRAQVLATAEARGYRDGFEAGRQEASRLAAELQTRFKEEIHQARHECLDIACKVASDILQAELNTDPSLMAPHIEAMLATLAAGSVKKISCGDDSLPPGVAVLECTSGSVTIDLSAQLTRAHEAMAAQLEEA